MVIAGAQQFVEMDVTLDLYLNLTQIPESFADCLGGLLSVMGQNISLKLEVGGDNTITTAHANRTVNWTTPNER